MSREWLDDPVVLKIRRVATRRGNNGIRELIQEFRSMDMSGDGKLSEDEFKSGISKWGAQITPHELKYLMKAMDRDGDGRISLDEFVIALTDALPARRRHAIENVFSQFDTDMDGNIPLEELIGRYDPTQHPKVLQNEMGVEEAAENLYRFFNRETNPEGIVTKEEFLTFYAGVSQNIGSDEYFETMLLSVWGLLSAQPAPDTSYGTIRAAMDRGVKGAADTMSNRTVTTHNMTTSVSKQLQGCYTGSGGTGITRNYNTAHLQSKKGLGTTCATMDRPLPSVLPEYSSTYRSAYTPLTANQTVLSKPAQAYDLSRNALSATKPSSKFSEPLPTGSAAVDLVRSKVFERGGSGGLRGLSRVLRVMDDNGNRVLDRLELHSGLQTYGIHLTVPQMTEVMNYFDRDNSGQITVTEFLRGIRGEMNLQRRRFVELAYSLLDTNGDQTVTLGELESKYDCRSHPEVTSRVKTPQQVLREFIASWDKNKDDIVLLDEFIDYYNDISGGIDDDDYFELMIRNAWHISGGQGWSANTTCIRVLVTHNDGTQTVEEIQNDLGLKRTDLAGIMKRLQAQGINDIKRISLAD